jgi:hypothetical protein
MALVQSGDVLTGELVSSDGRRFPLNGDVPANSRPSLRASGFSPTAFICGVVFSLSEFEFANGRIGQLSGTATGRCPGTIAGTFTLQR